MMLPAFQWNMQARYYEKRINRIVCKKRWMKASIAVDAINQVVVACKVRLCHAHDNRDFIPLVNQAGKFEVVIADKAYDSVRNHMYVREKLGKLAIITIRKSADKLSRIKSRYRKEMFRDFDWEMYFHRNKAESVFYVIKRRYGDVLYCKSTWMKKKELKMRILCYNVYRLVKLGFGGFCSFVFVGFWGRVSMGPKVHKI